MQSVRNERLDRAPDELVRRPAEEVAGAPVCELDHAAIVDDDDGVGSSVEQRRVVLGPELAGGHAAFLAQARDRNTRTQAK